MWNAEISVSSLNLHVIIRSSKGEVSTILSTTWNKTNPSTPIFRYLGDFQEMMGVLNSDRLDFESLWLAGTGCNYHRTGSDIFLKRFINFSSKWWIHITEWAVGNQSLRFTK